MDQGPGFRILALTRTSASAPILLYVGHVGGVASVEDFLSSVEGSGCLWLVLCGGYLLDAVVLGRYSGFTFRFVCWFGFEC